jgi:L-lactate dehydrogenase
MIIQAGLRDAPSRPVTTAIRQGTAYRERYGVTIALPTVVGRQGAAGELEPRMSQGERRAFERSATTLRKAAVGVLA